MGEKYELRENSITLGIILTLHTIPFTIKTYPIDRKILQIKAWYKVDSKNWRRGYMILVT